MAGRRHSWSVGCPVVRIGVVCEGPTDWHAIRSFLEHSMSSAGFPVEFRLLQPEPDATSSYGGWTQVLFWLKEHPPDNRIQRYFTEGPFGGKLAEDPLDGILIQLDSDILGDDSFGAHVMNEHGYTVANPTAAEQRAEEVRNVLSLAARLPEMTEADVSRHVLAPAVESTETWCVAAFSSRRSDFESLSGPELANKFMCALEKSESRPIRPPYANANKNPDRRLRFCEACASQSGRVIEGCPRFGETHDRLLSLAQLIAAKGDD